MINSKKIDAKAVEYQLVTTMAHMLKDIYSNKSSDEYKSHGDITASSEYVTIERMVADLSTLKKFPKPWVTDIKNLFNTLHRPVFKKMVTEYISEPNDRNTIFTAMYTVGFRVLVGELSRIYSSTEATDKGIEYKPDKVSKKNTMTKFIAVFNSSLEQKIDSYIKSAAKDAETEPVQEGVIEAIGSVAKGVIKSIPTVLGTIESLFKTAVELNPVSLINSILSTSYNKKVEKFEEVAAMYQATKEAYEEYMKIPEAQRKQKIESRYQKNLEKYNIKMNNLKAALDHYDQRSIEDAKQRDEQESDKTKTNSSKPNSSNDNNTSSDDDGGFSF